MAGRPRGGGIGEWRRGERRVARSTHPTRARTLLRGKATACTYVAGWRFENAGDAGVEDKGEGYAEGEAE